MDTQNSKLISLGLTALVFAIAATGFYFAGSPMWLGIVMIGAIFEFVSWMSITAN